MKKIIALLAVVALVVCCFAMTVNAANESPETNGVVSSVTAVYPNGNKANIRLIKVPKVSADLTPKGNNEVVIGQYTIENSDASPEYPITFTVNIAGVKKNSKVYVLAKAADGSINKIEATVKADGVVEFKLDKEYSELAFVTDKKTATSIGKSDKTGDVTTPIVMAVLMFSVLGMAVSYKKVRA